MRKNDIFEYGGLFSSRGPWRHSQRTIPSHELIIVTKGTVYLQEGEQEFTLRPNDYILLHPNVLHGSFRTTEEPLEFYWLHFYPSKEREPFPFPYHGTLYTPGIMIQMARQLIQIRKSPTYPTGTADHLLYVLLAELKVQREQQAPQNALAARVHEYIRSHADLPLTVRQVAESIGYHPDHLSRVLKSCYGFTLRQEINRQRMNHARFLLQTTDNTIARIAMEMGYSDPNLFEKFFRYHQKTTPTEYRNSIKNIHTNHK